MIDEATIKRVSHERGLTVMATTSPEDFIRARDEFARAIEQLARQEQREEDARICEGMADGERTTKSSRLMARECMAAIRAAPCLWLERKEKGNENDFHD